MATRFRHKLVIKRRYIKAYEDDEVVEDVFNAFKKGDLSLKDISEGSGVKYDNIRKWHSKYRKDQSYRPGKVIGQHRRIFSENEEDNIADMIKMQFIDHHVMIRRKHLRLLLYNCWQSLDPTNRSALIDKRFMSKSFLKGFCKRHRLSFRIMRKKKRSEPNPRDIKRYFTEIIDIFKKYPKSLIFNMDETAWNFVYKNGKVLAHLGKEEVDAQLPDDYKNAFTIISTISAEGGKKKPFFIATGKTNLCHKQFDGMKSEENEDYIITHSKSGKTTDEVMEEYLKTLNYDFAKGNKCVLILDQYASHISENTKAAAKKYNVKLVYIPVSSTDEFQPLDKYIFGILKSQACCIFNDKAFNFQQAFSKPEAADVFISLWDDLKVRHVLKAWDCTDKIKDSKKEELKDERENGDDNAGIDDAESSDEEDEESSDYDDVFFEQKKDGIVNASELNFNSCSEEESYDYHDDDELNDKRRHHKHKGRRH